MCIGAVWTILRLNVLCLRLGSVRGTSVYPPPTVGGAHQSLHIQEVLGSESHQTSRLLCAPCGDRDPGRGRPPRGASHIYSRCIQGILRPKVIVITYHPYCKAHISKLYYLCRDRPGFGQRSQVGEWRATSRHYPELKVS